MTEKAGISPPHHGADSHHATSPDMAPIQKHNICAHPAVFVDCNIHPRHSMHANGQLETTKEVILGMKRNMLAHDHIFAKMGICLKNPTTKCSGRL